MAQNDQLNDLSGFNIDSVIINQNHVEILTNWIYKKEKKILELVEMVIQLKHFMKSVITKELL